MYMCIYIYIYLPIRSGQFAWLTMKGPVILKQIMFCVTQKVEIQPLPHGQGQHLQQIWGFPEMGVPANG